MKTFEKNISQFTKELFPDLYKNDGPNFIAFIRAYYEWLETSDQITYEARRLADFRDIDKTVDDFLVYFKTKYLNSVQFSTASNKQLFIKNALDFYRSKGSERSVDLFFKLIYGIDADVYTPGEDIFRLSDNEFQNIRYLEVTHSPSNVNFVGTTVTGTISGTTAFVERMVRKKIGDKYLDVFYITNLSGDFQTNENLISTYSAQHFPKIIGSLSTITITSKGANFTVGESVYIEAVNSFGGKQGKARVASVEETTGQVTFTLTDGGFGYNTSTDILVSEKTMQGNNTIAFSRFETVTENLANIAFDLANSDFTAEDTVTVTGIGGSNTYAGVILSLTQATGAETGTMLVNFYANSDFTPSNGQIITTSTVSANITNYTDVSATGNVIATNTSFFGVVNVVNDFVTGGIVTGDDSGEETTLTLIPEGSGADVTIIETTNDYTLTFLEQIIGDYANVQLDAMTYGFPGDPNGNLTSNTIANILTSNTLTIGTISEISIANPGTGYTVDPFVVVLEPSIATYHKYDYDIYYTGITGNFALNEKVTGGNTGAIGLVKGIDTSTAKLDVRRLSISENFAASETITGETTGATATISNVYTDYSSKVSGNNAVITAESSSSTGSASTLEIVSSGFGYIDNESITFISVDDSTKTGLGTANLAKQGIGEGVFRNRKGFLSADKYIHDGDFYQEFSYQVLTGLPFETYSDTLKKVLHVAGTKVFGKFEATTTGSSDLAIAESSIETE